MIQPRDHDIILACKRLYRRKFLDEVMVVLEQHEDELEDTRGKRILDNIKRYTTMSAIFNWASAWQGTMKTMDGRSSSLKEIWTSTWRGWN
jgi:hypothetical protein